MIGTSHICHESIWGFPMKIKYRLFKLAPVSHHMKSVLGQFILNVCCLTSKSRNEKFRVQLDLLFFKSDT